LLKLEKNIFATKTNQITAYLVYMGILFITVFFNKMLFILLLPSAMLLKDIKYKKDLKSYLKIIISYAVPLYYLLNSGSIEINQLLSAEFIDKEIFYDSFSVIKISLIIGTIISYIRYEKQEL